MVSDQGEVHLPQNRPVIIGRGCQLMEIPFHQKCSREQVKLTLVCGEEPFVGAIAQVLGSNPIGVNRPKKGGYQQVAKGSTVKLGHMDTIELVAGVGDLSYTVKVLGIEQGRARFLASLAKKKPEKQPSESSASASIGAHKKRSALESENEVKRRRVSNDLEILLEKLDSSQSEKIPPDEHMAPAEQHNEQARNPTSADQNGAGANRASSPKQSPKQSHDTRPKCRYGRNCYRKNAEHREKFSHDFSTNSFSENESDSEEEVALQTTRIESDPKPKPKPKPNVNPNSNPNPKSSDSLLCKYYQRGQCKLGKNCPDPHDASQIPAIRPDVKPAAKAKQLQKDEAILQRDDQASEPSLADGNIFFNKTVCITGKLEKFVRRELTNRLANLGARVTGTVSGNTDFLIAGDKPGKSRNSIRSFSLKATECLRLGSKLTRAQVLGVSIWSEEKLYRFLESAQKAHPDIDLEAPAKQQKVLPGNSQTLVVSTLALLVYSRC